ncbi:unnamed protein product, partial [Linum tenue]
RCKCPKGSFYRKRLLRQQASYHTQFGLTGFGSLVGPGLGFGFDWSWVRSEQVNGSVWPALTFVDS